MIRLNKHDESESCAMFRYSINKLANYQVFLQILIISNASSSQEPLEIANSLFAKLKDSKVWSPDSVNEFLENFKQIFGNGLDSTHKRKLLSDFLTEYAKRIFYSSHDNNSSLQKAYIFFKLAAEFGNSESLYYLSFYSYYQLDGKFLFEKNFADLEDKTKHAYLRNYIDRMNSTSLLSNLYISSMQGYNLSTFIMGTLSSVVL